MDELGGLTEAKAWMKKRLGGQAYFYELAPGWIDNPLARLRQAGAELAAGLGLRDTAGAAEALEELAGPALQKLSALAKLGTGPLYYCPEAFSF